MCCHMQHKTYNCLSAKAKEHVQHKLYLNMHATCNASSFLNSRGVGSIKRLGGGGGMVFQGHFWILKRARKKFPSENVGGIPYRNCTFLAKIACRKRGTFLAKIACGKIWGGGHVAPVPPPPPPLLNRVTSSPKNVSTGSISNRKHCWFYGNVE